MRRARAAWRLLRAVTEMLRGAFICAFVFPFIDSPARMQHVRTWSRRTLRALGIELHTAGFPHESAGLVVANHISWLDILAIDAVCPVRFVSKADVRRWPLIGWMVACGGTLFIERERKRDAVRVVHHIAEALRAGDRVGVFPEGTTSGGHGLLPFHANLLQAAISAGAAVQPLVLRYADADHAVSPAAAYVGETTLLQSVWAIACAQRLRVDLAWLGPERAIDFERRALAERLRQRMGDAIACGTSRPPESPTSHHSMPPPIA